MKCAEIQYTIGSAQNWVIARNYFSFVLNYDPENLEALFGILRTCRAIEMKKGDAQNRRIMKGAICALKDVYKNKNQSIFAVFPLEKYEKIANKAWVLNCIFWV